MKTVKKYIRELLIPAVIGGAMLLMNSHFNSRIQNCEAQNEALEKEMWRLLLIMDDELTDLGYYVNDHVNPRIKNCEAQNEALEKEMWRLLLIMDDDKF